MNMSSSKKIRIENNSDFCQICQHLDEKKKEMVILTDPRLTTLYSSSDDNSVTVDTPQHRITEFAIHGSDRRLCWFDSKPIEEGYELFLCGYVLPIVSNIESCNEENMSNESPIIAQRIGKHFNQIYVI